jgi:hypothetical protein
MPTPAELVRRFYDEVWNRRDEAVAREILHRDFRFRGSLGPELRGPTAPSTICARRTGRLAITPASSTISSPRPTAPPRG